MRYLSTKKYISACIMYAVMFFFAVLLGVVLGSVKDALLTGAAIGLVLGVFFLVPAGYYLYFGIVFTQKAKNLTPVTGEIVDPKAGTFIKGLGSVAVKTKKKQYRTPTYFWFTEAQNLTGKSVSYCLINDTAFIFGVTEGNK